MSLNVAPSLGLFLETLTDTDVLTGYGYTNPLTKVNTCSTESKELLYAAAAVKNQPNNTKTNQTNPNKTKTKTENLKGRNA